MRVRTLVRNSLATAALALGTGCAQDLVIPADFGKVQGAGEESSPVGGATLAQRLRVMKRMNQDLYHLRVALDRAALRDDRQTVSQLGFFADSYIGQHLDPMLDGRWQSNHPEVSAVDANLRLAKADVLIRLDESDRAIQVLEQIEKRFKGREEMLVDFPAEKQSPLGSALKVLRTRADD